MQSVPQGGSRGPCGPCGPAVSMTCSCGGGDGVVVRAANNQLLLTIAAGCLLFTFHAYVFYSNDIIAPNILPLAQNHLSLGFACSGPYSFVRGGQRMIQHGQSTYFISVKTQRQNC